MAIEIVDLSIDSMVDLSKSPCKRLPEVPQWISASSHNGSRAPQRNGEWRFVTAADPPRLIAFSAEVQELRPESVTAWRSLVASGGKVCKTHRYTTGKWWITGIFRRKIVVFHGLWFDFNGKTKGKWWFNGIYGILLIWSCGNYGNWPFFDG